MFLEDYQRVLTYFSYVCGVCLSDHRDIYNFTRHVCSHFKGDGHPKGAEFYISLAKSLSEEFKYTYTSAWRLGAGTQHGEYMYKKADESPLSLFGLAHSWTKLTMRADLLPL